MAFWKRKDITLGEQSVSEITILEWKRFFSIKLFHFHKTEGKQDRFHTHAFNAVSILLHGNYVEEILDTRSRYRARELQRNRKRFLFIPADTYHRITKSEGCRTLLITGPWGAEFKELRHTTKNYYQEVVCGKGRVVIRTGDTFELEGV